MSSATAVSRSQSITRRGKRTRIHGRSIESVPDQICRIIFDHAEELTDSSDPVWDNHAVWEVGTRAHFEDMLIARGALDTMLFRGLPRQRRIVSNALSDLIDSGRVIFHECECRVRLSNAEQLVREIESGLRALAR